MNERRKFVSDSIIRLKVMVKIRLKIRVDYKVLNVEKDWENEE